MILIKTDELNYLIYRYFLEQGLQHSAFTLSNEAGLKEFAHKYHDDVRPGHLVNLMEKALLFTQMEDHIHMNQIFECNVPQQLIERHVCQFTERKAHIARQEAREREVVVSSALNRSQEFQNHVDLLIIQYIFKNLAKSSQTIDKNFSEEDFLKCCDFVTLQNSDEIFLTSWNSVRSILAAYQPYNNCIKHLHCEGNHGIEGFKTLQIVPACISETFNRVKFIKWDKAHGNYLLIVFENGVVVLSDAQAQIIKMFNIKNPQRIKRVVWNPNWPNILATIFEKDVEIIDVFKCATVRYLENAIDFEWRFYDQFIVMDQNYFLNLWQIDLEQPLLQLKAEMETSLIEFNSSKTLLASFSSALNTIKIWTMQSDQYILEISGDHKILSFCWCSSQNANYLITFTINTLNVWDVEFGSIKCSYKVDGNIHSLHSLDLLGESPYIALMTSDNKMLIYDLINRKRKIVSLSQLPQRIIKMNEDEILFIFPNMLSVLNVKNIETD